MQGILNKLKLVLRLLAGQGPSTHTIRDLGWAVPCLHSTPVSSMFLKAVGLATGGCFGSCTCVWVFVPLIIKGKSTLAID